MRKRSGSLTLTSSTPSRRRRIVFEPTCDSDSSSDESSDLDVFSRNNRCPRCFFSICICTRYSDRVAEANTTYPRYSRKFGVHLNAHESHTAGERDSPPQNWYQNFAARLREGDDGNSNLQQDDEVLALDDEPYLVQASPSSGSNHSEVFNNNNDREPEGSPLVAQANFSSSPSAAQLLLRRLPTKLDSFKHDQANQTDEPCTSASVVAKCHAASGSTPGDSIIGQIMKDELDTFHSSLLSLLECPVCLEYIAPPIHQCRRGHLICSRCKPQLLLCPSCRERFSDTRNLAMEKVADQLLYPCKNSGAGCGGRFLLTDKADHENNCNFRSYNCVFRTCEWNGFLPDYLVHLKDNHSSRLLVGDRQTLNFGLGNPTSFLMDWMVHCYDELFRVNIFQNIPRCQLFALVQYFGPSRNANDYYYALELERSSVGEPRRKLSYCRTTHSDLSRLSANYTDADCLTFKVDAVNHFATNGNITINVSIGKNK